MEAWTDSFFGIPLCAETVAISRDHAGFWAKSTLADAGANLLTQIIRWDYIGIGLGAKAYYCMVLIYCRRQWRFLWICRWPGTVASLCDSQFHWS